MKYTAYNLKVKRGVMVQLSRPFNCQPSNILGKYPPIK